MDLLSRLPLWISVALATCVVAAEPSIDPECWKITLPLPDAQGQALEVTNPQFASYIADPTSIPDEHAHFFRLEDGAYVFHCRAGGATTLNSKYSRTELREMRGNSGTDEFEWTLAEGGTLELRFKVGPMMGGADKVIFVQIHGYRPESKPLLKCLWEKGHLRILIKSGEKLEDFTKRPRYLALAEGQWHTCRVVVDADELSVAIDGEVVERFDQRHLRFWPKGNTFYFKAGNYLQEKDDGSAATVSISHISLEHGEQKE